MISFKEAVEFLSLLNTNSVRYLIIGGAAVNVHGYTRATGDLDIWYDSSVENFNLLLKSIQDYGYDTSPISKLANNESNGFIRLPVEPFFIELLSAIDGKLDFNQTYKNSIQFDFHGVPVPVIGYDELIQNKIMSRRAKDLEDIAQLEKRKNNLNKK